MRECKVEKPRVCSKCKGEILTTAAGIKAHAAVCVQPPSTGEDQ